MPKINTVKSWGWINIKTGRLQPCATCNKQDAEVMCNPEEIVVRVEIREIPNAKVVDNG